MARRRYEFIAWQEAGMWTVHAPSLPGVYGVGDTLEEARTDFAAAASDMLAYLADIGEPPPRPTPVRIGRIDL